MNVFVMINGGSSSSWLELQEFYRCPASEIGHTNMCSICDRITIIHKVLFIAACAMLADT